MLNSLMNNRLLVALITYKIVVKVTHTLPDGIFGLEFFSTPLAVCEISRCGKEGHRFPCSCDRSITLHYWYSMEYSHYFYPLFQHYLPIIIHTTCRDVNTLALAFSNIMFYTTCRIADIFKDRFKDRHNKLVSCIAKE